MFLFYFFAAILIFFSYKSFRGGVNYLRFFKQEIAKPKSDFTPFVSIIAPCRGLDENLRENLSALFEQNFPGYEIVFVVDDKTDAAVKVIKEISEGRKQIVKLIVAGKATNESQKIHNLREAVLHVSSESKVFVFVDSDARPAKSWLRNLIAPLQNEATGCATGYRWFVSKHFSFASEMRAAWNASIASALGANTKSNFCWGGAMALRRETFEKLNVREEWKGTLSDDFVVTRVLKKANLQIFFAPAALAASIENCSLKELFEFTTRQMKITRVYAAHLWRQSFLGSFLFNLVFISGIFILIFSPAYSFQFLFAFVALFLISTFSIGKSWLRLTAVKLVLTHCEDELNKQFWTQNALWIFSPAIYLYNCACAFFSNEICWRGIKYKLISPRETIIIQNDIKSF